jgi:hypothetical protein
MSYKLVTATKLINRGLNETGEEGGWDREQNKSSYILKASLWSWSLKNKISHQEQRIQAWRQS